MKSTLALLALVLSSGCSRGAYLNDSIVQDVEMADLLANPNFYNNAVVKIHGAVVLRFEANFICATEADIDAGDEKRCLWLSPIVKNKELGPLDPDLYDKKRVVMVGVFDKNFHGHMGAYGGSIAPINVQVVGTHNKGELPPPPPPPSANNSFKPKPLRGSA